MFSLMAWNRSALRRTPDAFVTTASYGDARFRGDVLKNKAMHGGRAVEKYRKLFDLVDLIISRFCSIWGCVGHGTNGPKW